VGRGWFSCVGLKLRRCAGSVRAWRVFWVVEPCGTSVERQVLFVGSLLKGKTKEGIFFRLVFLFFS
jgi:hypothetical protein